jgi:hypothetical protein
MQTGEVADLEGQTAVTRTDTPRFIATEEILWLQQDGSEVLLVARVGTPYPVDDHTWACAAALDGRHERFPDILGAGAMQSLCLAISLLRSTLGHLIARGERLVHPGQRSEAWTLDALASVFGRGFEWAPRAKP